MTDDERAERVARARSSAEAKAEELRSAWQAHAELYNQAARLKADAARMEDEAADYYALWDYLLGVKAARGAAPEGPADAPPAAEGGARRPGRQGRRRKDAEKTGEEAEEGGAE